HEYRLKKRMVPVKRQRIVHVVHGGDPRASRSALTSDGAARVGRRCGPPWAIGTPGGHAAGLSLATRRRRSEGPLRSMRRSAMDDAVENGVSQRWIAEHGAMP